MISAVIVNWNSGPLLARCVRSLQAHAPGCEIVVVDNASKDASIHSLAQLETQPTALHNTWNLGFAAACNQGWRASRSENILFINPDAEALQGSVQALERRLDTDGAVWAAGGRLIEDKSGEEAAPSVRAFPSVGAVAAEMLLLDEVWPRNPWRRRYRMTDWDHNSARDVDQPAGACLMVRRSALEALNGFDEAFWPAWFEDVDLCKRIRDAGGRIVFDPVATFLHQGAVSLCTLTAEEFMRSYYVNMVRYFHKHHGLATGIKVRRLIVAGLRLRALMAAVGTHMVGGRRLPQPGAYLRAARAVAGSCGVEP